MAKQTFKPKNKGNKNVKSSSHKVPFKKKPDELKVGDRCIFIGIEAADACPMTIVSASKTDIKAKADSGFEITSARHRFKKYEVKTTEEVSK